MKFYLDEEGLDGLEGEEDEDEDEDDEEVEAYNMNRELDDEEDDEDDEVEEIDPAQQAGKLLIVILSRQQSGQQCKISKFWAKWMLSCICLKNFSKCMFR